MKSALVFVTIVASLALPAYAADNFPNRPVRVVVPFPAGGATDVVARLIGQKAADKAGQPFIIDNRGGAAGNTGSDNVAKSPGDGYSVLHTVSSLALSPALYHKLPFDPIKDFIAVTQLTASPLVIVAGAETGINSLADLVARAKAKPGELNFGSGGVGNPQHLVMEMLKAEAGIDMVHVPFKGDAPLFNSLVAGDIELACVPLATALPHIQAGTLKAIAVSSAKRNPTFPDTPAIAETYPGVVTTSWQGWFAPAATPRDIVMKLNGYARAALQAPARQSVPRRMSLGPHSRPRSSATRSSSPGSTCRRRIDLPAERQGTLVRPRSATNKIINDICAQRIERSLRLRHSAPELADLYNLCT